MKERTRAMDDFRSVQDRLSAVLDRPLTFIVGATRWGTAWVQQCLDTHPDVRAAGEGHFSDILFPRLAEALDDYNGQCARIANRLDVAGLPASEAGFTCDDMDHLMRTAVALMFDRWAAAGRAACLVEKTPEHVALLDVLTRILPSARVIHVICDGRDEAAAAREFNMGLSPGSFPRTYPTFADFAEVFAGNWKRSLDVARRFQRVHPNRFLEVRAEKIMRAPMTEAEKLFRFLGVGGSDDADLMQLCSDTAWDAVPLDLVAGTWRQSFDETAERAFRRHAGELLKLLGYTE
ncbi:MAG: sulfotransferase [Rhodospirillaceae bacterium]